MFGVAVNYFCKSDYPPSVKESAKFALALLKNCPEVTSIVLTDGSLEVDDDLKDYCDLIGVIYKHAGKIMSFAEAYNFGVSELVEDWIVTMASDIYVFPSTFTQFKQFIETHKDLAIGCLIPYLSRCDLPFQRASQKDNLENCYVPIMSYNMNLFPKTVFEKLGGLTTRYTGNFNDVYTSLKLQEMGLDIILANVYVHHYGRLTIRHGSNVDARGDWQKFYSDYPELKCNSIHWSLRLDKFLRHPLLKRVHYLATRKVVRNKAIQESLINWVYDMIPVLQRIE